MGGNIYIEKPFDKLRVLQNYSRSLRSLVNFVEMPGVAPGSK